MKKTNALIKFAVITAGFLVFSYTSLCQTNTSLSNHDKNELARLAAMMEGITDAKQASCSITDFAMTDRNELLEFTQQESLNQECPEIRLLKKTDGKLLAVRQKYTDLEQNESIDYTHYFNQNGKTFAFIQNRTTSEFGKTIYGKRTIFFDANLKIIRQTDSFQNREGKPVKADEKFDFLEHTDFYANSAKFLTDFNELTQLRFDETFTRSRYFQLTGHGFKKTQSPGRKDSKSWRGTYNETGGDTLVWFNTIRAGLNYALRNYKYLMVYYEPTNYGEYTGGFQDVLQEVNRQSRLFHPAVFNENFVLVKATDADTLVLKKAGIFSFPGAAFFSGDNQPLLTFSATGFDEILKKLAINQFVSKDFKDDLQLQYLTTHAQPLIRKTNFNPQLIKQYLATCVEKNSDIQYLSKEMQQNQSVYDPVVEPSPVEKSSPQAAPKNGKRKVNPEDLPPPVVEYIAPEVNRRISSPNFKVDSAFMLEALDSLVLKNSQPDLATAGLIIQVMHIVGMSHFPVIQSPFLSKNDTTFAPAASYVYLLKNFQHFKNVSFPAYFQEEYTVTPYEVLNKPLAGFITNRYVSAASLRKALLFQKELVDALPEFELLGKPLHISNLITHADSLSLHNEVLSVAVPYAEKLLSAKPNLHSLLSTTAAMLYEKYPKESKYVVRQYGDQEDESYDFTATTINSYLKNSILSLLNEVAWYLYQTKANHQLLNEATRYAKAALELKPTNPYALDTYAHLLYVKGDRTAAIAADEKALKSVLREIENDSYNKGWQELAEIIKVSLSKMKAGTLQ